jgi:hypothetical protein
MARIFLAVLTVGVFVGALAGGAAADFLGESPQSDRSQQSSSEPEFVPEGNFSGTDWQTSGMVETGSLSARVSEEPWMKEYGQD